MTRRYHASSVEINAKVRAYEKTEDADRFNGVGARREVTLGIHELFKDDEQLDEAIAAFAAAVKEAARR